MILLIPVMDRLTSEQRHRNMQNIKNKDTGIERLLRKELWKRGYRYRKNDKSLPGKPDIVLPKYRVAVFCDSEFFHGKDWRKLRKQLQKGNNPDFWIDKIKKNRKRDRVVTKELEKLGWTVMRFWGKDIKKDPGACAEIIKRKLQING